jgi:hypothetical protein
MPSWRDDQLQKKKHRQLYLNVALPEKCIHIFNKGNNVAISNSEKYIFVFFIRFYEGDKIKEDETNESCSTRGRD